MPDALCLSYAKINLYLDVLDKRPDGFHNIETLFHTVSWADEHSFSLTKGTLSVACNHPGVPSGPRNLVWRAADLLRQHANTHHGADIRITKRIPVAAGLAGGSGNAAATLAVLNQLWNINASPHELAAWALELGSDVPYCLIGGPQTATGRGEVFIPTPELPAAWFVLAHPPIRVTAREAYLSPSLQHSHESPVDGMTSAFRLAINRLANGDWANGVFNRMESGVFPFYPQIEALKQRLLDAGCIAAAMSGSGSTVFGVCLTKADAERAADACSDVETAVVETINHGWLRIT